MRRIVKIEDKHPFRLYLPREAIEDYRFSGKVELYGDNRVMLMVKPGASLEEVSESLELLKTAIKFHRGVEVPANG